MIWSRGSDNKEVGGKKEELKSGKELSQLWPPGWLNSLGTLICHLLTPWLPLYLFSSIGLCLKNYLVKWLSELSPYYLKGQIMYSYYVSEICPCFLQTSPSKIISRPGCFTHTTYHYSFLSLFVKQLLAHYHSYYGMPPIF